MMVVQYWFQTNLPRFKVHIPIMLDDIISFYSHAEVYILL